MPTILETLGASLDNADIPLIEAQIDRNYFFAQEFDNASGDLTRIIHSCLFSVQNPRFLVALERYCWMYFIASRLSSEGTRTDAPWVDFVLSTGATSSLDPDSTKNALITDPVASEDWTGANNGKIPAVVASALSTYARPAEEPALDDGITLQSSYVKIAFTPAQLCDSLSYEGSHAVNFVHSQSPFEILAQFYEDILDATHNKSFALGAVGLWKRNVNVLPEDPQGVDRSRTASRGLSASALFLVCFNMFRKLFSEADGYNDHPRISRVPTKLRSDFAPLSNVGELTKYLIPISKTHPPLSFDGSEDIDLTGPRLGTTFQFSIPVGFRDRGPNVENACDAVEPSRPFTMFSDLTKSLEQENKSVVRALAHIGAIADTMQKKRIGIGEFVVGNSVPEIIKEQFPRGSEPPTIAKEIFSRTGAPHVAGIFKTLERRLPFTDKSSGLPSSTSFLPLHKTTSGSPAGETKGRFAALKLLLNSEYLSVSEDNVFDPTNARVFCVGIPLAAYSSLVNQRSTNISGEDIPGDSDGTSISENELVQDNTLVKITFSKKDNMLPTVTFTDISYYYDPNLFVAADGFFNIDENAESIEEVLSLVKFKRAVVASDTKVSVEDVVLNDEGNFEGGGYLPSLDSGVSKQLAYITVVSDLLSYYNSLVAGLDVTEDAFCTDSSLLNQLVDSSIGQTSPINIGDLLGSVASSTNVPITQGTAQAMVSDEELLGSSRIVKSLQEMIDDGSLDGSDQLGNYVQSQKTVSSLLFKPNSERLFSLIPKRFAGVAFLPVDPDAFRVENPNGDDDSAGDGFGNASLAGEDPNVIRGQIQQAGLEIEVGESVSIVKSGNSEDATSLTEIFVTADFVSLSLGGVDGALPIKNELPENPFDLLGEDD